MLARSKPLSIAPRGVFINHVDSSTNELNEVALARVALSAASPLRREKFREVKLAALGGGGLFGGAVAAAADSDEDAPAIYALGCNVGRQVGDLDCFSSAEIDTILMGTRDVLTRTEPRVELPAHLPKGRRSFKARQQTQMEATEAAGKAAIAAAAAEEGAVQTETGLVVKILVEGDGASPAPTDTVRVHYEGKLTDGTVFDSSLARGEAVEFPLDRVVPGWSEGLAMMKVGGKAKLTIPPELAYGDRGQSTIPPKATLISEVTLEGIIAAEATAAADDADADADDAPEGGRRRRRARRLGPSAAGLAIYELQACVPCRGHVAANNSAAAL